MRLALEVDDLDDAVGFPVGIALVFREIIIHQSTGERRGTAEFAFVVVAARLGGYGGFGRACVVREGEVGFVG